MQHVVETNEREKLRWSAGPVASSVITLSSGSSGKAFGCEAPISSSHGSARRKPMTFMIGDLRDPYFVRHVIDRRFDEIYQLAADMGGAGYIFTGEHDADVMHNSASINLNILQAAYARNNKRIFYSSSACMYPEYNQLDPDNPNCAEASRLSGRTGQRIRLGEAVQRAALPCLWPQSRHGRSDRALPQYFWARGELERRQGEGAGGGLPQSCDGAERRRGRNLGRRKADPIVSLHR